MKTATRSKAGTAAAFIFHASNRCLGEPQAEDEADGRDATVPVHVEPISAASEDAWRQFVRNNSEATLFHDLSWKHAVERCFPHQAHYLLAQRGSKLVGILPLFEVRSYFAPRFLLSVPYGTYGGLVANDDAAAVALAKAARLLGSQIGAASLQIRSAQASLPDVAVERTHAAFYRDLPTDVDAVPSVYPRKARAAARQAARRQDFELATDRDSLRPIWLLYARSMRRLGSPNYPYRFFQTLSQLYGRNCVLQLLRLDGRPVAGLLSFVFKETIMPYFVGVDERIKIYGLTHFLYQQCMIEGVRRGCRTFDFGRTRYDNKGPFDFKRHCGFEPTPLEYQTLAFGEKSQPDLSPTSARWRWARQLWTHLPLTVTRPVGAWAARSIPG